MRRIATPRFKTWRISVEMCAFFESQFHRKVINVIFFSYQNHRVLIHVRLIFSFAMS